MLKREIKYEDFNGNETSEIFYFNISKSELVELQYEYSEGFETRLQNIIDTKDNKELIKQFKELILMAYGEKSEDGKRFIKSDDIREAFSQTAAYQSLFMELATDDGAAVVFIRGILPKDMQEDGKTAEDKVVPLPGRAPGLTSPPKPPTPPTS